MACNKDFSLYFCEEVADEFWLILYHFFIRSFLGLDIDEKLCESIIASNLLCFKDGGRR
jgi:hypothetical protein